MQPQRVFLAAAVAASLAASSAGAIEIEVVGNGAVNVHAGAPNDVKAKAIAVAKKRAVALAVDKVLGPGASLDAKIAPKFDTLVTQVPDSSIIDTKSSRVGDDYTVTLTLSIEDKKFRTLLSDLGIALNTATVRAYSVLAVMDEFLTSPRDVKAPLEELVQFRHEAGASFADKSSTAMAAENHDVDSESQSAAVDARYASRSSASRTTNAQVDQSVSGRHAETADVAMATQSGAARARTAEATEVDGTTHATVSEGRTANQASAGRLTASESSASAHDSGASTSASTNNDVKAETHDNTYYQKLIKYQPQGGSPEKTSQTYNALVGQLQDYDVRVIDNDLFRSKYFKDKPVTISELQNSEDLSKYVAFARSDAHADFFMVGTSIIIDSGKNAATGEVNCSGVVTVKTYSTADGESIASETSSEVGAGGNLNDCAGNVAKKLARISGASLQLRISDYWKRRATYGREYTVSLLTPTSLPLMVRMAFSKTVAAVAGVQSSTQRTSNEKQVQLIVSYKGSDPIDQAIATGLMANNAFSTLDAHAEGTQVVFCMGPCSAAEGK